MAKRTWPSSVTPTPASGRAVRQRFTSGCSESAPVQPKAVDQRRMVARFWPTPEGSWHRVSQLTCDRPEGGLEAVAVLGIRIAVATGLERQIHHDPIELSGRAPTELGSARFFGATRCCLTE